MIDVSLILWLIPTAITINALFFTLQYLAQRQDISRGLLPPRHSTIPGTNQPFLYLEDSLIQPLGNLLCLSFIWVVFIHLIVLGFASDLEIVFCVALSLFSGLLFHKLGLNRRHRHNWRYPRSGKISFGGVVSLIYFNLQVFVVVLTTYKTLTEVVDGIFLVSYLIGMSTWLMIFLVDFHIGRFDPLEINLGKP